MKNIVASPAHMFDFQNPGRGSRVKILQKKKKIKDIS
jgi:hypothetical protein